MKEAIKKILLRWLLGAVIGKTRLEHALELVRQAEEMPTNAFGKRGYVYRQLKEELGEILTTKQLNLSVELAVNLADTLGIGKKKEVQGEVSK